MSSRYRLNELNKKRASIAKRGGEEKNAEQHGLGKLTANERLKKLLDDDSFVEIDSYVEHRCIDFGMEKMKSPGDGVITGYGRINGRLVFIFAQDYTVINGSVGEIHASKICKVIDMAIKMGAPLIGIYDSAGARVQEGLHALKGYGEICYRNTKASGVIPQLSIILGPCAGSIVYSPAITDFIFMVNNISEMFLTGPEVIATVTGEKTTTNGLGGSHVHGNISGVAQFVSQNEEECFQQVRELISYIPSNNLEDPPLYEIEDNLPLISEELERIIPINPSKSYDIRQIIEEIVDFGKYLEVSTEYAGNIVTCFARLNGRSIGIIGNQPKNLAGCLDMNSSNKASRFIRFCDAFNIPIITLVDTPGYIPSIYQEHGSIIRHGAKLFYAYSEATVPKITVVLRKAYGGAYIAMCSKHIGCDMVFAWPTAEISVMEPEGAANILFKNEIETSNNPHEMRQKLVEKYKANYLSPYYIASKGYLDDVIAPQETKVILASSLEMLISKHETLPNKKHGNIPL